jgi:hypothetical protein
MDFLSEGLALSSGETNRYRSCQKKIAREFDVDAPVYYLLLLERCR